MRIACASWSRRHAGGIESYLGFIIPALRSLGHEVGFWTERNAPAERAPLDVPPDVETWCAAEAGPGAALEALRAWAPSVVFVHGLVDPDTEARLLDIAPAVLLAHSYYGTCISGAKTHRFPNVQPCARTLGPACLAYFYPRRCGGLNPLTTWAEYRRQTGRLTLLPRYRSVLTLSAHMRSEYMRHGLDPDRVVQLPPCLPGVTGDWAAPEASGGRHNTPPGGHVTLLFLGRIDSLKGLFTAIEALPEVHASLGKTVRLLVAGDGPDRERCERLAADVGRSAGVSVAFEGWISAGARDRLFAGSDVLVFPSLWPEPYGLAGLEALAAGLPVAAFGSGAVGEWLRDGIDGALAPADPPSPAGLAQAIVKCVRMGRHEPWAPGPVDEARRRHAHAVASNLAGAAARNGAVRVLA